MSDEPGLTLPASTGIDARIALVTTMNRKRSFKQQGMTLIEILVVLTLIGVVLGIVGSNYLGKSEQAKAKAAKIEIEQISQALDLFKLELGRYPSTQEGLQALVAAPPSPKKPSMPLPPTVAMIPVAAATLRMRWLNVSAM